MEYELRLALAHAAGALMAEAYGHARDTRDSANYASFWSLQAAEATEYAKRVYAHMGLEPPYPMQIVPRHRAVVPYGNS